MYVLDILAFWKSTADSFQHKFFVTLWSFHQERHRNKSSSASLFVSGELLGRAWPRCYRRFSVDFPILGYKKTKLIRLNQITRTDNNRDEKGVRSRNRDNFICLQYRSRKDTILLLSDFLNRHVSISVHQAFTKK